MGVVTYMQIKFHWSSQKILMETHSRNCVKYYYKYVEKVLVIFLHIQFNFSKTHEQKVLFYRRSIENEWVLFLQNQDKFPLEFHKIVDTSSWKQRSLEKGGDLIANILKIWLLLLHFQFNIKLEILRNIYGDQKNHEKWMVNSIANFCHKLISNCRKKIPLQNHHWKKLCTIHPICNSDLNAANQLLAISKP
jgi:hypothetical protein